MSRYIICRLGLHKWIYYSCKLIINNYKNPYRVFEECFKSQKCTYNLFDGSRKWYDSELENKQIERELKLKS